MKEFVQVRSSPGNQSKTTPQGLWHIVYDNWSLCFASTLLCRVLVLTRENYPEELALKMIKEVQEKVYTSYPKVKEEESTEMLTGVRIFMSDICNKYNSMIPTAQEDDVEAKQIEAERIKELGDRIKLSQIHIIEDNKDLGTNIGSSTPSENRYERVEGTVERNRNALLVLFILACGIYIITAILDSTIN